MKPIQKEAEISLANIHDTIQLSFSFWLVKQPTVILDQTKLAKKENSPLNLSRETHQQLRKYPNYSHNYIDGSKDSNRTKYGAEFNNKTSKKCPQKKLLYLLPKPAQ